MSDGGGTGCDGECSSIVVSFVGGENELERERFNRCGGGLIIGEAETEGVRGVG